MAGERESFARRIDRHAILREIAAEHIGKPARERSRPCIAA